MIRHWTEEEINYLKENYFNLGAEACSIHLNRTICAIQHKCLKLGLKIHFIKYPKSNKLDHKFCTKCKLEKNISEFIFYNKTHSVCKPCYKDRCKDNYNNNLESIKLKSKMHYENNKEKHFARTKKWCENNKEKRKKICKKYCQSEKGIAKRKEYFNKNKRKILDRQNKSNREKKKKRSKF